MVSYPLPCPCSAAPASDNMDSGLRSQERGLLAEESFDAGSLLEDSGESVRALCEEPPADRFLIELVDSRLS